MHQHRTIRLLSLGIENFIQQVIEGSELLRVFFNCRVVGPGEHLIVLDGPLAHDVTIGLVLLLQVNYSASHSSGRRSPI